MFTKMLRSALVVAFAATAFAVATAQDVSWNSSGGDSRAVETTAKPQGDVSWNVLPGAGAVNS